MYNKACSTKMIVDAMHELQYVNMCKSWAGLVHKKFKLVLKIALEILLVIMEPAE